jgi:PAS domain S-box-containing protein
MGVLKMKDIVVICPIQNIYDTALDIIEKHQYQNIDVLLGNMSEGVVLAGQAIAAGAKIIVSRGGTYHMIREAYSIPITEIKVDAYDIIESYQQIDDDVQEIGVVGYGNIIYGFDIIRQLIPERIHMIELHSEEGVYDIIRSNKEKGINYFIGDANIIPIVQQLGCKGKVIQSRAETIRTAMQEARRILRATKHEKERTQWVVTMTDFIHDGVIAIDREEHVTIFNRRAEEIFGISKDQALGKKVSQVVPNSVLPEVLKSGKPQHSQIQKVHNTSITTNRIPIMVDEEITGAVATFQEITEVQNLERKIRRKLSEKGFVAKYTFDDILYQSKSMEACIHMAKKYAAFDTPIHICGSSGVGKELFCQSIHNASPRANGPFVAINCAAISPSLIESELFGYVEGSFTGAGKKGRAGIFELAHEGTLFLDEISELPIDLQSRLLRVLQEKQVMRIGDSKMIPVDVRIITASNRYLGKMIQEGTFRKDLYFRINILTLRIPELSRRKEDILPLAELFIKKYAKKYNKPELALTPEVKRLLLEHDYQGNVRELEGMMEKSVILSSFDNLDQSWLRAPEPPSQDFTAQAAQVQGQVNESPAAISPLKQMESEMIQKALHQTGGNMQEAAKILGISRTTLWRKLRDQSNH